MDHKARRRRRPPKDLIRRGATVAGLVAAMGAVPGSAVAGAAPTPSSSAGPTTVVSGDSVVVTSLPSFGPTTITVTRPDAITGAPVVIGLESGTGNQFTPFSANTVTPSPLDPTGDCWQRGALSQALTPDIQPGDTVTVVQTGGFGGGGTSSSTTVQPGDEANAIVGPIAGCASVAPWARNAITSAPSSVAAGDALTVSGVAQPLATEVSVSASDGTGATAPVSTTPASDGSWSVTIPASSLEGLANRPLTVTPVVAVPDVNTGASAHIRGVGVTVPGTSASSPPATTNGNPTNSNNGGAHGTTPTSTSPKRPVAHVTAVHAPARASLTNARKHGITVSFVAPSGIKFVQVSLRSGRKTVYVTGMSIRRVGARQVLTLPAKLAKRLHVGKYTVAIRAGTSRSTLGSAVTRTLRLT